MGKSIEDRLDALETAVFGGNIHSQIYRCSCCNKLRDTTNKIMKIWEQPDDTRVGICRGCNTTIIRHKCRSVVEYKTKYGGDK